VELGKGALRVSLRTRALGWAAKKAGAYAARKFSKQPEAGPLSAPTTVGKTATQAVISAGSLFVVIQALRGFMPDRLPWPAEMDNEIAMEIGAALGTVMGIIALGKNLWKNFEKVRNGIALRKGKS
jgi:hypothetical protein